MRSIPLSTTSATASSIPTHRATWKQITAGVAAVGAAYVYFLIFSEFAFLRFASEFVAPGRMPALMAALAVAGVAGSCAAAALFAAERARRLLAGGFAACALTALLTLPVSSETGALFASAGAGFTLGWTTVILALCLRPTVHRTRLGLWCGLGTGLAYATCNLPFVFTAPVQSQIKFACCAAIAGLASSFWIHGNSARHYSASGDYKNASFALWLALFLVLVFLDSLMFYLIHHSPALRQIGWTDDLVLFGNAFVHLCAAVLAGIALDRGWPGGTLFAALAFLVTAALVLGASERGFPAARILYLTGVSVYSTALVWFAARCGRRWKTAVLFSTSGWIGSALAIGIAMRHTEPATAWRGAFAVLAAGMAVFLVRYVRAGKYAH